MTKAAGRWVGWSHLTVCLHHTVKMFGRTVNNSAKPLLCNQSVFYLIFYGSGIKCTQITGPKYLLDFCSIWKGHTVMWTFTNSVESGNHMEHRNMEAHKGLN